jgi:hypothetical protein
LSGGILKFGIKTSFTPKVMQVMSINLSEGITKVLRILKPTERPQARTGAPSVRHAEAEELQVSAHNYYQSIIQNSLVSSKTYEPPKQQTNTGSHATLTQGSDHDHWFDQRSQNKGHKAKDSNYRLQAFLQPGKVKELKTLDKNYLKRQGS